MAGILCATTVGGQITRLDAALVFERWRQAARPSSDLSIHIVPWMTMRWLAWHVENGAGATMELSPLLPDRAAAGSDAAR